MSDEDPPPWKSVVAAVGGFIRHLDPEMVQRLGQKVFTPCACPGCLKSSAGASCSQCHRPVCNRHGKATLTVPPKIVCVECITEVWLHELDGAELDKE